MEKKSCRCVLDWSEGPMCGVVHHSEVRAITAAAAFCSPLTCTTMSLLSSTLHSCLQTSRFFSNGVRTRPSSSSRAARLRLQDRNEVRS